jgi:hypothetical protein
MNNMPWLAIDAPKRFNVADRAEWKRIEEACTALVRDAYSVGIGAAWIQNALWNATDPVAGPSVEASICCKFKASRRARARGIAFGLGDFLKHFSGLRLRENRENRADQCRSTEMDTWRTLRGRAPENIDQCDDRSMRKGIHSKALLLARFGKQPLFE